jgi:hypothetical protein
MTALATGVARQFKDDEGSIVTEYEVEAGETIYQGGLVVTDTDGYALPGSASANVIVRGWADETVVNAGADGAAKIRVRSGCSGRMAATSVTRGMVGAATMMECVDDNTVDDSGANDVKVGPIVAPYISTTECWVYIPRHGAVASGL